MMSWEELPFRAPNPIQRHSAYLDQPETLCFEACLVAHRTEVLASLDIGRLDAANSSAGLLAGQLEQKERQRERERERERALLSA